MSIDELYRRWVEGQARAERLERELAESRDELAILKAKLVARLEAAGFSGGISALMAGSVALTVVGGDIRAIVLRRDLAGPGHPAENPPDSADPGAGARDSDA